MKKIINNRVYDSDKAVLIGGPSGHQLYRKKTGEYFFLTGNKIIPSSFSLARSWAKDNLPEGSYLSEFEDVPLDYVKVKLNISISKEHLAIIRRISAEQGKSISQIFDDYIDTLAK